MWHLVFLLFWTATITSATEIDCEMIQIKNCPEVQPNDPIVVDGHVYVVPDVQESFKVGYETFVTMKHSLELTTTLNVIDGVQMFVIIKNLSQQTINFFTRSYHNFTKQMYSVESGAKHLFNRFETKFVCASEVAVKVFDKLDCIGKLLANADEFEEKGIKDRLSKTSPLLFEALLSQRRLNQTDIKYRNGQAILHRVMKICWNQKGVRFGVVLTPENVVGFMQDVAKEVLTIMENQLNWIHPYRGLEIEEVKRTMNVLIQQFKADSLLNN